MNDLDPFQGSELSNGEEWKQDAPGDLEARKNRKPILILGLVALAAVFAMSLNVLGKSTVYYKTPSEVLAEPGTTVRVSGTVVPGSIEYDSNNGVVTFQITDDETTMSVDYAGTAPDTLKDNAQAVAEGKYVASDEVFEATTLFAKCPSKFTAKTPGADGMSGA
jgi:cytochrome c-type biogenesis protein CcmE